MITVDKVLADLEHDKLLARENHQYGVAKGCTELQGRYLAMFKDHQILDKNEVEPFAPGEREQLQRLARQFHEWQFETVE